MEARLGLRITYREMDQNGERPLSGSGERPLNDRFGRKVDIVLHVIRHLKLVVLYRAV